MKIRRTTERAAAALIALALCVFCVLPSFAYIARPANVDVIFEFLVTEMGFNSAAACGVLANIEKECAFIEDLYGDDNTSYGLCQWHDYLDENGNIVGRFTDLRNFCNENGYDWQTVEGQLYYLKHELTSGYWYLKTYNYLLSVPNTDQGAYDAAYYWCFNFEIPANRERGSELRGTVARDYYWPLYGDGVYDPNSASEIWRVGSEKLTVRTSPDDSSSSVGTLAAGAEIRVREISLVGDDLWAHIPLGWCRLSGLSYVSGELYTVSYKTGCAVSIEGANVNFRGTYPLADADKLIKYGYIFVGWEFLGETREPGYAAIVTSDVVVSAVWQRDGSLSLIRGDASSDGKLNAKDVTTLMRYLVGADNGVIPVTGDVNRDFKLNAKDVTLLMKYLVGAATFNEMITIDEESSWMPASSGDTLQDDPSDETPQNGVDGDTPGSDVPNDG